MMRLWLLRFAVLAFIGVIAATKPSLASSELSNFSHVEQQILLKYVQKIYAKIISYRLTKAPEMNSGEVVVGFTIAPSGSLQHIAVVRSSGEKNKDMLAMKLVWTAAPFPPPPKIRGFDRKFTLPIRFIDLRFH
jgi:TonB family protein